MNFQQQISRTPNDNFQDILQATSYSPMDFETLIVQESTKTSEPFHPCSPHQNYIIC